MEKDARLFDVLFELGKHNKITGITVYFAVENDPVVGNLRRKYNNVVHAVSHEVNIYATIISENSDYVVMPGKVYILKLFIVCKVADNNQIDYKRAIRKIDKIIEKEYGDSDEQTLEDFFATPYSAAENYAIYYDTSDEHMVFYTEKAQWLMKVRT